MMEAKLLKDNLFKYLSQYPVAISFISPLFILFAWFSQGKFIASGEDGLFFAYPERSIELYKSVWINGFTGFSTSDFLPRLPFLYFVTLLKNIGLPVFMIQAMCFYLLMLTGIYFCYKCTLIFFENAKFKALIAVLAGFFYLYNPFSLTQLWTRQLYSQYFLFALFPLFLYLFIKGFKTQKYIYICWIAIVSVVFSTAFGLVTNMIVIWSSVFLFVLYEVLNKSDSRFFKISFFVLSFLAWVLANLWWLLPFASILNGQSIFNLKIDPQENLITLNSISRYSTFPIIMRLLQGFYFFETETLRHFYLSVPIMIFSFVPLIFVIWSFKNFYQTKKLNNFITVLFFVGLNVSLGNNFPFGKVFVYLFEKFTFLQAFRNPYEKYGIVFMFAYVMLLSSGLVFALEKIKKHTYLILCSGLILWLIYLLPLYLGKRINETLVSLPQEYLEINKYLSQDPNSRVLVLPLTGEGVSHIWGYAGVESSLYLLNNPAISYKIMAPVIQPLLSDLSQKITNGESIQSDLDNFNIKYILVRNDLRQDSTEPADAFLYKKVPGISTKDIACKKIINEPNLIADKTVISCILDEVDMHNISSIKIDNKIDMIGLAEINILDKKGSRSIWRDRNLQRGLNEVNLLMPSEQGKQMDMSKITAINVVIAKRDTISLKSDDLSFKMTPYDLARNDLRVKEIFKTDYLTLYEYLKAEKTLLSEDITIDYKERVSAGRLFVPMQDSKQKIILDQTFNTQWLLVENVSKDKLHSTIFNNLELLKRIKTSKFENKIYGSYKNSWEIPVQTHTDYGIVFVPQVYADLGMQISQIFIIGILIVLGFLIYGGRYRT